MAECECPDDPTGCEETTQDGYAITFYKGFLSAAAVTPMGGSAKSLYRQVGSYRPQTSSKKPASKCGVRLRDPNGRDVRLKLTNEPQVETDTGWEGPIVSLTVVLGDRGGAPIINTNPELVKVQQGEDQIVSITVQTRAAAAGSTETSRGGVQALSGGDTWVLDDNASTCPKQC